MKKQFDIYEPTTEVYMTTPLTIVEPEPRVINLKALTKKRRFDKIKTIINKREIWLNTAKFADEKSRQTNSKTGKKCVFAVILN